MPSAPNQHLSVFTALRARLFALAYRMLGTRADADDLVQDAWLRWQAIDIGPIVSPEAFLVTVATRLSLDRLRELAREREQYVGWWLPEPLVEVDHATPELAVERASEVSFALVWMLQRLAVEERAAFLLREVFDYDYADIAAVLEKSAAACRQLVHRASERVKLEQARFGAPADQQQVLVAHFIAAAASGDQAGMKALMAQDVRLFADGGGKVNSFLRMLRGAGRVAGVYWSLEHQNPGRVMYVPAQVNGAPGVVRYVDGVIESVQSFLVEDGRIADTFIVRNPDKLRQVPPLRQMLAPV